MNILNLLRAGIVLLLVAGPAAGAPRPPTTPISDTERALVRHVDRHNARALALLERVVDINSGTLNLAGVREVGAVFRAELDRLGFRTRWIDGEAFARAGHLVAERPGPGPRIVLIGHLDTVFEPDSPFQTFRRLGGQKARGPGVIDMKGGDVILLSALEALHSEGLLAKMNLVVVMTGDEESPGRPLRLAREALVAAARGAEYAIGFEDGDGDPRHAVVARRGSTSWRIRVRGAPAHSSLIFREEIGTGAIFEAARILDAFREKLAGEAHLTFNPGAILGGTSVEFDAAASRGTAFGKNNVLAEHVVVTGDLRALTEEQFRRAKDAMGAIVGASLPHARATIEFDESYPPLAPGEGNEELLAMYDRVSRDLGFGPVTATNPDEAGAADVSFLSQEVPRILDAIGLKGTGGHTVEETADLETLPIQTKRATLLLHRLSQLTKK